MLGAIQSKLTQLYCKAATDLYYAKNSEQGDTNFLSILIVLVIVLVIAGAFILLKDKIVQFANTQWDNFEKQFGGSGTVEASITLFK